MFYRSTFQGLSMFNLVEVIFQLFSAYLVAKGVPPLRK